MEDGSPKCVALEAGKRRSPSSGQPPKRLKQAILPFKQVGPRSSDKCTPQTNPKKRPLSCSEDDGKNIAKCETEVTEQDTHNNNVSGTCKENLGPPRSRSKSDTPKKCKTIKQNTGLKQANSVPVLVVDLSCDSRDGLGEIDARNQKSQECFSGDLAISPVKDAKSDKVKALQLPTPSLTKEVENLNDNTETSNDEIEKQFIQNDAGEVLVVAPRKELNLETNDNVNSSIEVAILSSTNAENASVANISAESIESHESADSVVKSSPLPSNHIDECIDSVVKNFVSIEDAAVSANSDIITQKDPIRKKKLRRSASEEVAKQLEIQEKLKIKLETAKLRAELKRQREEDRQEREERKMKALAKRRKDEIEKLERSQLKEEERKKKEEALQTKVDEKLRKAKEKQEKDDEKRKVEEEEKRKTNKVKAAFVSFFMKKDTSQPCLEQENVSLLRPTDNVQQAPVFRNCKSNSKELVKALDDELKAQTCSVLYLEQLKKKEIFPGKSEKQIIAADKEVEIIECSEFESNEKRACKAKLLQFSENVRPPYWGTWRKKSKIIKSRSPFARDDKVFDYEVDSEAEWDEEEPGESLSHSEGEKESEDDYEVDNEFFVPHGYLSDEENEDGAEMSPTDFKEQLKLKQKEFEIERKRKCLQLKPNLLGCFWLAEDQSGNEEMVNILESYSAILLTPGPVETRYSVWLTASLNVPLKTPSPNSSKVDDCPLASQIKSDKSLSQHLSFTPKCKKPVECKKICDSPLIDLTDDIPLEKKPRT